MANLGFQNMQDGHLQNVNLKLQRKKMEFQRVKSALINHQESVNITDMEKSAIPDDKGLIKSVMLHIKDKKSKNSISLAIQNKKQLQKLRLMENQMEIR